MRFFLPTLLTLFLSVQVFAQIPGCTDPQATNYNPAATVNNGSCVYNDPAISPWQSIPLHASVKETSGLTFHNASLITHNDDGPPRLFILDTLNAQIIDSLSLNQTQNIDWEDLQTDASHFYVGDVGNNSSGNRQNLRIFKVPFSNTNEADTIGFSYPDQLDFNPLAANTTNFDCEAFVVFEDSIYLFSKRWNDLYTFLYAIPNSPGNHSARLVQSFDAGGLVTGASVDTLNKRLVLCGYSPQLQPFIWLLYDFENRDFFSGNKRKLSLNLPLHQIEAITQIGNDRYVMSNEFFHFAPLQPVYQALHYVDLHAYFSGFLSNSNEEIPLNPIQAFPNPAQESLGFNRNNSAYSLLDLSGKTIENGRLNGNLLSVSHLKTGIYFIRFQDENELYRFVKVE